jgi:hypothetical protein
MLSAPPSDAIKAGPWGGLAKRNPPIRGAIRFAIAPYAPAPITVGISLFRRKVPCSEPGNSLFGAEQGIVRNALELQYKWTLKSAESAEMAGDFQHFPAIFPALREYRGSRPA